MHTHDKHRLTGRGERLGSLEQVHDQGRDNLILCGETLFSQGQSPQKLLPWRRERRVEVTPFAIVSPLFLLPSLMSNLLMMHDNTAMRADIRRWAT